MGSPWREWGMRPLRVQAVTAAIRIKLIEEGVDLVHLALKAEQPHLPRHTNRTSQTSHRRRSERSS